MGDCTPLSTYDESKHASSPPASRSCSSTVSYEDTSPIRHVLCVTRDEDIKRFEEAEDCFILDFDPFERFSRLRVSKTGDGATDRGRSDDDSEDLVVIAEKGQVACRDYPHSRHLCQKFPFATTLHERHCELCYCYVLPLVRSGPMKAIVMRRSMTKGGSQRGRRRNRGKERRINSN